MNEKTRKILLYLCIVLFGAIGIYLTFFRSNVSKYDSKTKAYDMYVSESEDSDGNTMYRPTYYFEVDGKKYECKSGVSSSSYPKKNKNTIYYDSSNPKKCLTEYEKSSSKLIGIICLVVTGLIVYFGLIKKTSDTPKELTPEQEAELERKSQIAQENVEKAMEIFDKVQLIYKRIVIGIIIVVLLVLIFIDALLFKQTLESKNYIETTATLLEVKEKSENEVFDEAIYVFKDKQGNEQKITISVDSGSGIDQEIKIKYNENNPEKYYEESALLSKSGMIWFVVKIVAVILLILLFLNKNLLYKINISTSRK